MAEEISIKYGEKNVSGSGEIILNESEISIETSEYNENSKIFYTFNKNPQSFSWVEKIETETTGKFNGFKLKLSQPAEENIQFDWWLLKSE